MIIFINVTLINCSCNCCIFILCRVFILGIVVVIVVVSFCVGCSLCVYFVYCVSFDRCVILYDVCYLCCVLLLYHCHQVKTHLQLNINIKISAALWPWGRLTL
jgi:hypothetical protein